MKPCNLTKLNLPVEKLLQYYLWRWGIEVNFRDEKTLIGTGQAQVRGTAANQVAGVENVLVTAGTGVPTSGLILGRA